MEMSASESVPANKEADIEDAVSENKLTLDSQGEDFQFSRLLLVFFIA